VELLLVLMTDNCSQELNKTVAIAGFSAVSLYIVIALLRSKVLQKKYAKLVIFALLVHLTAAPSICF